MSEQHLPLFVYGTLRPGASKHQVIKPYIQADGVRSAKLKGYQMVSFGTFPALVIKPSLGIVVEGDLLSIRLELYEECLQRIDQWEGNGWTFERVMEYVIPKHGLLVPAWVYIAKAGGLPLNQAKPLVVSDWFQAQRG